MRAWDTTEPYIGSIGVCNWRLLSMAFHCTIYCILLAACYKVYKYKTWMETMAAWFYLHTVAHLVVDIHTATYEWIVHSITLRKITLYMIPSVHKPDEWAIMNEWMDQFNLQNAIVNTFDVIVDNLCILRMTLMPLETTLMSFWGRSGDFDGICGDLECILNAASREEEFKVLKKKTIVGEKP